MKLSPDSAQARLAASRKTLIRYMSHRDLREEQDLPEGSQGLGHGQAPEARLGNERSGTWHIFTQAVSAWWQHHPAHMAVDIGRPFLNNYARNKPLQLLGIAAGLGVAAVLLKPWRLVSITGLAVAAIRSAKLSTTLLSLIPRAAPGAVRDADPMQTQQFPKDKQ